MTIEVTKEVRVQEENALPASGTTSSSSLRIKKPFEVMAQKGIAAYPTTFEAWALKTQNLSALFSLL